MKVYKSEGFDDQYVFTETEHWLMQYILWRFWKEREGESLTFVTRGVRVTALSLEKFWSAFNAGEDYKVPFKKTHLKVKVSK